MDVSKSWSIQSHGNYFDWNSKRKVEAQRTVSNIKHILQLYILLLIYLLQLMWSNTTGVLELNEHTGAHFNHIVPLVALPNNEVFYKHTPFDPEV